MKSIKSFALAAIAILGVACGKPAPTPVPTDVTFYPAALTVTAEGTIAPETVSFKADAAAEWTIVVPNAEWLTVTGDLSGKGNGSFNVAVAANEDPEERDAAIRVVVGEKENIFKVSQEAAVIPAVNFDATWVFESGASIPEWDELESTDATYDIIGLNGKFVPATEGDGKIQFYNATQKITTFGYVPKASYPQVRLVAKDGTPYTVGSWPEDYWLFVATTEEPVKEGATVTLSFSSKTTVADGTAHPNYWVAEVSENGGKSWYVAGNAQEDEGVKYHMVYTANGALVEATATYVLLSDTKEIQFRVRALNHKVDPAILPMPTTKGVTRISSASIVSE